MSDFFADEPEGGSPGRPVAPPRSRRPRPLLLTVVVVAALVIGFSLFTGVWTDKLWFGMLGYGSVFSKLIWTRVLLFVVFGGLMALVVGVNIWLAYRLRPMFRPHSPEQANLERYREVITPLRRVLLVGVSLVFGVFAGISGSGKWRTFLLWDNRTPFGKADPYFHKDVGFYVFSLPWLHYLVDFAMTAVFTSLLLAAVVHYLYGGIRLQSAADKVSGAAQAQLSALFGVFLLLKGIDYYIDRFDLTSASGGLVTGMTYTRDHAVLPSKTILMFIAVICAVLFFANIVRRTWLLPGVGLALFAISAVLLGGVWPGLMQRFQVKPDEPDKEASYIGKNIQATRSAFGLEDTGVTSYDANTTLSPTQLDADAASKPGIRLLDPQLVSSTFDQLQQVRGYYSVPGVLDVDRYDIAGKERDMVVAARELHLPGLPDTQKKWANEKTVYTHGYGLIAAYGNQQNAQGVLPADNDGEPIFAEEDLPPTGQISDLQPDKTYRGQIYFGENSPNYSIVGRAKGGKSVELDVPQGSGTPGQSKTNTYAGKDGVGVGSLFRKLLYATKFGDFNIVLSSRVNANSKILYDRSPRERVQKVAPWLIVDSDALPAVVDGKMVWVLDGYTTSDKYPGAEKKSLQEMTSDAINPRSAYATLPTDQINYMNNSVKATVDMYDGTVNLYAWNSKDPILRTWEKAFPGVVKSQVEDPAGPARAHALSRGPLQGAARHARGLPRARPEDVLRGQRPVGDPRGPLVLDAQAAAVPAVGGHQGRHHAGVLADHGLRAAEEAEPRLVHGGGRRRGRPVDVREVHDPAAARHHAGARPLPDRQPVQQRPEGRRGGAPVQAGRCQDRVRQPAHPARGRRPAVRAAALHHASERRGHLPGAALRAHLVRSRRRHRQHAGPVAGRRAHRRRIQRRRRPRRRRPRAATAASRSCRRRR